MEFLIDKETKQINVKRKYDASLQKVWAAWTESETLDKWWAPKPWKAKTKSMDFSEGGYWLYSMLGPEGEEHWARFDFSSIKPLESYSGQDAFCDKDGNVNTNFARSSWTTSFSENNDKTTVSVKLSFDKVEDMEQLVEMGFNEGFTMGLQNLDDLLNQ